MRQVATCLSQTVTSPHLTYLMELPERVDPFLLVGEREAEDARLDRLDVSG